MANWKKVIVSGSNADLNHITASGNISASGFLFGNLPTGTEDKVIIYDSATGQLKFKVLNLVSTVAAPGLFLADIPSESNIEFKLGFDRGSATKPITAPFELSASYTLDGSVTTKTSDNDNNININGSWTDVDINQLTNGYYTAGGTGVNVTSSITDRRNGLLTNGGTGYQSSSVTLHLQSILNTNQAVPGYDLTQANLNYGNRGINDGGVGKLKIYVNTNLVDSPTREINLSSNYNAISSTANGITAALFATQSNKNNVGEPDTTKHYRSGSIIINADSILQNDGYNYAFLLHTGSKNGTDFARITNFQEWFYDLDGNANQMVATAGSSTNPNLSSAPIGYLSGIKYLRGGTGTYTRSSTCTNQYRNIYNNGGGLKLSCDTDLVTKISVTQSGAHLATNPTKADDTSPSSTQTFNLAPLDDTDESYLGVTTLEANYDIDLGYGTSFHAPSDFIDTPFGDHESAYNIGTSNTEFESPNKTDKNVTFSDINDFLLNRLVSSSTTETRYEQFRGEEYRIKDGTYTFNSFTPSSHAWDSEKNIINGGAGFDGGLIQYYSHLVYPTKAGTAGNFNPSIAPTSNADYSSATGTRTYHRYFKCDSGGFKQFQLEFKGSGKIVKSNNALTTNSDEIHVFVQRLGDGSTSVTNSSLTTLIDAIDDSVRDGATFFDDAHHIPVVTSGISYSQATSVGPGGADNINVRNSVVAVADGAPANLGIINNEYILVKIEVPQGWTGYLDAIAIRYGNLTSTPTPLLNSLSPS